jgi:hypothetical protein
MHRFNIPVPKSTLSDQLHPDKGQLRSMIYHMRGNGMSYRQIGVALGIHWTRVQQIVSGEQSISKD